MPMSNKIPFFLVTGFLGSGKTTLLRRFLDVHADRRRIAVVQNEFAQGSVDGADLRRSAKPFEIMEINRGSVFCVCLLSDFMSSLVSFVDTHRPDAVVLEASGLADPIAIAQLLRAPELASRLFLAYTWCVVDASTFLRLEPTMTRMSHQVRVADTAVINKTDRAPDQVDNTTRRIAELNPFARIEPTSFCDLSLSNVFSAIVQPVAVTRADENASFESCGRPNIGSAVLRTTTPISRNALESFLREATAGTQRVKGFVVLTEGGAVAVQSCFGRTELIPVSDYRGPTELVAMGRGIDSEQFTGAFHRRTGRVP